MKANKAKTSKKAANKVSKRVVKKELEASISDKFMEALKGLGHDAGKFTKEIKKTSQVLAKKLSDKFQEVKVAVEEKLESKTKKSKVKKIKKPLTSAKKTAPTAVEKAVKVVAKAAMASAKAPVRRVRASKTGNVVKTSLAKPVGRPATVRTASAANVETINTIAAGRAGAGKTAHGSKTVGKKTASVKVPVVKAKAPVLNAKVRRTRAAKFADSSALASQPETTTGTKGVLNEDLKTNL